MLPAAIAEELVINRGPRPVSLPQKLKQSVEVGAFYEHLLPLFDVRYLLSES